MSETLKRILITEDEKPMGRALQIKFEKNGFSVTNASDGEEALAFLEKETFDVILLDLIMPKINGFKVLETLKDQGIKTPVCVMTNLSQEEDKEKATKLGARDFFVKSDIAAAEIVERVKSIFV